MKNEGKNNKLFYMQPLSLTDIQTGSDAQTGRETARRDIYTPEYSTGIRHKNQRTGGNSTERKSAVSIIMSNIQQGLIT